MKLTHTRDDCLSALLVSPDRERRVFLRQLGQTVGQLLHILLCLRLNGDSNHRIGEVHRLKYYRSILIAQRVTGMDIPHSDYGTDVSCRDDINRVLMVREHLEQTRDALLLAGACVVRIRTGLQLT